VRALLYQVELLLSQQTVPTDTAAIITDPVSREGGLNGHVPTLPALLQGLRAICDKNHRRRGAEWVRKDRVDV
jgi:4-aminobutyrate aminotransferase